MSTTLLGVNDVCRQYSTRMSGRRIVTKAVDGVSFSVERGGSLALVGESGSGKSTVARLVLGLLRPSSGTVEFAGADISTLRGAELRQFRSQVQIVFQSPHDSVNPRFTIAETIAEPLVVQRRAAGGELDRRVEELLDSVGLDPGRACRYPHEFSGGELQRVCIARALALNPSLIVCDEPVSALDAVTKARILQLFAEVRERFGVAYLFISHDLSSVRRIADSVAVMHLGRIVELDTAERVFRSPQHPQTKALVAAVMTAMGPHLRPPCAREPENAAG